MTCKYRFLALKIIAIILDKPICSRYFDNIEYGSLHNGVRCENLENLTFADEVFDIFITKDVFEHILAPDKAYREIWRVLKPGGVHILQCRCIRPSNTLFFDVLKISTVK